MAEVITLSSDDEESVPPPPKKKPMMVALCRVGKDPKTAKHYAIIVDPNKKSCVKPKKPLLPEETIILSDDDDDNEEKLKAKAESVPSQKAEPQSNPESTSANLKGTSSRNPTRNQFYAFLNRCIKVVKKPAYRKQLDKKLPVVKRLYEKLENRKFDFAGLLEIIKSNEEKWKTSPEKAVKCFCDVYQWLKSAFVSTEKQQVDSGRHGKIIRKLEHALYKIRLKTAKLDEAEVDFDEEENSQYLQAARYKQRASQIYKKLCQYQNEDPNYGRLTYLRLDFSRSNYSEINQALNRKYKNNTEFPTYFDVDKCIRKCVEQKGLNIPETELKIEIKRCFEELGNLLQRRRRMELFEAHNSYLSKYAKDPAIENPRIERKLRANYSRAKKGIQEVVDKYAALQENGVNPEVSSSSDDSDVETEDEEEEENIKNK